MAYPHDNLGTFLHAPRTGTAVKPSMAPKPSMRAKAIPPGGTPMPPMNAMPPVGVGAPNPGAGVGVPTGQSSPNFSQLFGFQKPMKRGRGMK